jgi:diguanylate cyclase (GGDEF)-like protein
MDTHKSRIDKDKLPLPKRITAHVFEEAFMEATALSPEDFKTLREKIFAHAIKSKNAPLSMGLHNIFFRIADRRDELIQNKIRKLEKEATTDPLTDLLNRRGLAQMLDHTKAQLNRKTIGSGAVLNFDLNDFKKVNDTHGHDSGDALLKLFADHLKTALRDEDIIARPGGDEFTVILTHAADSDGSANYYYETVRNRLHEELNALNLKWEGATIPLSVSIGMAVGHSVEELEKAMSKSDQDMYDQKIARKTKAASTSSTQALANQNFCALLRPKTI